MLRCHINMNFEIIEMNTLMVTPIIMLQTKLRGSALTQSQKETIFCKIAKRSDVTSELSAFPNFDQIWIDHCSGYRKNLIFTQNYVGGVAA